MNRRSVLITGCSSGMGLAMANRFTEHGWRVFAGLRDVQHVPANLHADSILPLDLTDDASIEAATSRVDSLDCLVHNAGYALIGPYASYTTAQMQRQMQVNFLAPALLTQLLLPALRKTQGRIICISSMAGETGLPMNALYCASKFALEGWAESLVHELAPHGVQIALVEPGGHRTRFAANAQWGARSIAGDSIEQRQRDALDMMRERMLARAGKDPAAVVNAVLRLVESKRMPLRTRVGSDARMLHWLKVWLPERLAQHLIASAFRRQLPIAAATPKANTP
jgi:NAD(P)-dependent dehydrogenase (short-subunit alcohol dehydrogenase family)